MYVSNTNVDDVIDVNRNFVNVYTMCIRQTYIVKILGGRRNYGIDKIFSNRILDDAKKKKKIIIIYCCKHYTYHLLLDTSPRN